MPEQVPPAEQVRRYCLLAGLGGGILCRPPAQLVLTLSTSTSSFSYLCEPCAVHPFYMSKSFNRFRCIPSTTVTSCCNLCLRFVFFLFCLFLQFVGAKSFMLILSCVPVLSSPSTNLIHVAGVEQAVGQGGRMPLQISMQGVENRSLPSHFSIASLPEVY